GKKVVRNPAPAHPGLAYRYGLMHARTFCQQPGGPRTHRCEGRGILSLGFSGQPCSDIGPFLYSRFQLRGQERTDGGRKRTKWPPSPGLPRRQNETCAFAGLIDPPFTAHGEDDVQKRTDGRSPPAQAPRPRRPGPGAPAQAPRPRRPGALAEGCIHSPSPSRAQGISISTTSHPFALYITIGPARAVRSRSRFCSVVSIPSRSQPVSRSKAASIP
ncbi:MAG: hypothetical protein K0R39_4726, partial [Symbiobacteriaceae bacterium]|nr:hypothetical protein [Symbiobacteriaceae bacterium]